MPPGQAGPRLGSSAQKPAQFSGGSHVQFEVQGQHDDNASGRHHPSTDVNGTAGINPDPLCDKCGERDANMSCTQCQQVFCTSCCDATHSMDDMGDHNPKPFVPPPPCQYCNSPAAVVCDDCNGSAFCQRCDERHHRAGARQRHHRADLAEETELIASGSGPRCSRCDRPAVIACQNQSCNIDCCRRCDQKFHDKGNRAQHKRTPIAAIRRKSARRATAKQPTDIDAPSGDEAMVQRMPKKTTTSFGQHRPQEEGQALQRQLHGLAGSTVPSRELEISSETHQFIPLLSVHFDYQDSGVLAQKVLVADGGIRQLAKLHSPGGRGNDQSDINFAQLNKISVTTVGLYGNSHGIEGWLVKRGLLDRQGRESLHNAEPGLYCLSVGASVQFLVHKATDNAFTELSRKNISCNLVRYLLDLCEHVLVFFAADETFSFRHRPFASKRTEKRTHMMVMQYKKESEENVSLLEGFTVPLTNVAADGAGDIQLSDSRLTRSLHVSRQLPRRREFQKGKYASFNQQELEAFFARHAKTHAIHFAKHVDNRMIFALLNLASPDFQRKTEEMKRRQQEVQEQFQAQEQELRMKDGVAETHHEQMLDYAVMNYVDKHCRIATFFCQDFVALQVLTQLICPVCHSIFTEPWTLPCKHTFCKSCIGNMMVRAIDASGQNSAKAVFCSLCSATPVAVADGRLPGELDTEKQAKLQNAQQYTEDKDKLRRNFKQGEIFIGRAAGRQSQPIEQGLAGILARLQAMERAYVVFSLAIEQGYVRPKLQKSTSDQMEDFVLEAVSNGNTVIKNFINRHKQGIIGQPTGSSAPTERQFNELESKQRQKIQDAPLAYALPDIFKSHKCRQAATMIVDEMKDRLKKSVPRQSSLTASLQEARLTLSSQKESIVTGTLEEIKRMLQNPPGVDCPLELEISMIQLHDTSGGYAYEERQRDQLCRLYFREQAISPIDHVHELYTFDLLKHEAEKLQENANSVIMSPPRCYPLQACFPVSPDMQEIVKLHYMKNSMLLVFVRNKAEGGIMEVYFSKAVDYRKQTNFPRPFSTMKRDRIDLVDFDEDSRTAVFYAPEKQKVEANRFDRDWKNWQHSRYIDITVFTGSNALLSHMVLIPRGQDKLCLIDDKKVCHVFDMQEGRSKGHPIEIKSGIRHVLASLDGSCLLVFSVEQRYASPSSAIGGHARSPLASLQVEYNEVVVMYVYSLDSRQLIRSLELDRIRFPPETLPSFRLVMLGPQMHLVAVNSQRRQLVSMRVDISAARNTLQMIDMDKDDEKTYSAPPSGQPSNYLDYLYHVYDKFCVEDCLDTSNKNLSLACVVDLPDDEIDQRLEGGTTCKHYIESIFGRLSDNTHKPMQRMTRHVTTTSMERSLVSLSLPDLLTPARKFGGWLQLVICLVPIQICRAEHQQLTLFSGGMKSDAVELAENVCQLQDSIEFGLYEAILDSWTGPVKVISSMGKQSTGKSYMLNHLTGSLFDIAGGRCTDGVWLTVRLAKDCLYIVLDFEGLGSMERTEQEDMLLSLLNAAISGVTVFKTEYRLDQDTGGMLARFRDGVDYIKGDPRILRGCFYINIKDVDQRDIDDLQREFQTKLGNICREDENNFLMKMYGGKVIIQTFPMLGNAEFYSEMNKISQHLQSDRTPVFQSSREFKEVLKLLMAKIHMQEWSSFDRNMVALKVDRLRRHFDEAMKCSRLVHTHREDEPLSLANGEPLPDEDLTLKDGKRLPDLKDSDIDFEQDKQLLQSLVNSYTALYNSRGNSSMDVAAWTTGFQDMLARICKRRSERVKLWVKSNVEMHEDDGDVRIFRKEVDMKADGAHPEVDLVQIPVRALLSSLLAAKRPC